MPEVTYFARNYCNSLKYEVSADHEIHLHYRWFQRENHTWSPLRPSLLRIKTAPYFKFGGQMPV